MSGGHRGGRRRGYRDLFGAVGLGISWGVFALVMALGVATLAIPSATGSTSLTIVTGSMQPALPPGTLIIVRPTPAADIRLGDVLTYQQRSGSPTLISHRVVEVRSISDGSHLFVTKGDANDSADPTPVSVPQIVGITWYSVPLIGYLSTAVAGQPRTWLPPLIGVGLVCYAAVQIVLGGLALRRRRAQQRRPST